MTGITRRYLTNIAAGIFGGTVFPPIANAVESAAQGAAGEPAMDIQRHVILEPSGGKPFTSVTPIISYVTVRDNMVYLAGITADPAHPGDIKDQTTQVLGRIDRLLKLAGTDKSKLLTVKVWLTDMSLFATHNEAWNAWVDAKSPPVRACLHSPQLWAPGLIVEIMVTAAK